MRLRNARADFESSTTSARLAVMPHPLVAALGRILAQGRYRGVLHVPALLHLRGQSRGAHFAWALELAIELGQPPGHMHGRPALRVIERLRREPRGALRIVPDVQYRAGED